MVNNTKMKIEKSFNPKCIYIFRINDPVHKDLLKIGDAIVKANKSLEELTPNCKELNQAAKLRIKDYTNTAGIGFELLHTELAVMEGKDEDGESILLSFKDHKVHSVLVNSNIERVEFPDSTAREWFKVDLNTAKAAITAVKEGRKNLSGEQITQNYSEIVFRPEQEAAIRMTLDRFKSQNKMLWNAKMRFGKTLSALEVVRKSRFARTIIITHRPVVDSGWYDDFNKIFYEEKGTYIYGSKGSGTTLRDLISSGKKYVYFASMQDLRGSRRVGGPFLKNDDVFDLNWDFVIVDEAHEGTTTILGDSVIKAVVKEDNDYPTKFLALSGTPFNILNNFDNNIYTWDYIMEQKAKAEWNIAHLEPNPYDDLPEMHIFTYDIGKLLFDGRYIEVEDKAFNFREFFRVWTGDKNKDGMEVPEGVCVGDFYHEEDVLSFLNLICAASEESQYPYSTGEYRNIFRHTLWMVPGVKEAKALSKMLKEHPVFSFFDVVNVAGEGDEEEAHDEALKKVRKAIKNAGNDGYTITLSCGKLTTGVTIPEWTAAFYLAGSFATSASSYLQTIFRVQSPCNKYGMMKNVCYVFDFAPDRTLKMIAEAAAISTKAGGTSSDDRAIMGEFLNYCPVISIDGTRMRPYDTGTLLQQLKRAYADRAVRTGFDDINIYSNELLKLTEDDLSLLKDIKGIIGTSKASHQTKEIDINAQGFTEEEHEAAEAAKKKPKKERTPEEEELLKELAEKRKQRKNAISVLRGISIRMPLLIYGADIPFADDVTIEQLPGLVDDSSWTEFMPTGITKEKFRELIRFYDPDIFVAAGRKIRSIAKDADELPPIERAKKIAALFSCFKNPDKETVLTPWRIVNMQMGMCLGGYNFYDETYKNGIETPRYIDNGTVTERTLGNPNAKILEINSKTGLFPLYVAASIFLSKCKQCSNKELTIEKQELLWKETIEDNVYVICKTPMAKTITQRTLAGYRNIKVNAHAFDNLVNQITEKSNILIKRVLRPAFWEKEGKEMHFNAIVGNPPYMSITGGGSEAAVAATQAKPIFQHFVQLAKKLSPDYTSMIIPARWYNGGIGLNDFREDMLRDHHLRSLVDFSDSKDCFSTVDIAGGICYFLWDKSFTGKCMVTNIVGDSVSVQERELDEFGDLFIRSNVAIPIINKIRKKAEKYIIEDAYPIDAFGFPSKARGRANRKPDDVVLIHSQGIGYVSRDEVRKNVDIIDKYKVTIGILVPSNGEVGIDPLKGYNSITTPRILKPGEVTTFSYLIINTFDTEEEAINFRKYMMLKLPRYMMRVTYSSMHIARSNFIFVPCMDFTKEWTDKELYDYFELTHDEQDIIEKTMRTMN